MLIKYGLLHDTMTHTSPGRPLRQRHVGLGGRQCAVHQHRRREVLDSREDQTEPTDYMVEAADFNSHLYKQKQSNHTGQEGNSQTTGGVPFLDVDFSVKEGKLKTDLCRKPACCSRP